MRKTTVKVTAAFLLFPLLVSALFSCLGGEKNKMKNYKIEKTDIQSLLERPYSEGVVLGYNEDVYSLYQPGWGFDSPTSFRSGSEEQGFGMKVLIKENGTEVPVGEGVHTPAYTSLRSADDDSSFVYTNLLLSNEIKKTVSFAQTSYGCNHEMAFDGENNENRSWNTWCPTPRNETEWLEITFPSEVSAEALVLFIHTDSNCLPPESLRGEYCSNSQWRELNLNAPRLSSGKNTVTFDRAEGSVFKFYFTPVTDKALSFPEIELLHAEPTDIKGNYSVVKYVMTDGGLSVIISAENKTDENIDISVELRPLFDATADGDRLVGNVSGLSLVCAGDGFENGGDVLTRETKLRSGETISFRAIVSFSDSTARSEEIVRKFFSDSDPVLTQKNCFIGWFEENIPYIDVPDEDIKRIYYYRWYSYRANIRHTASDEYVISEFLPKVGWSGAENSINMASGMHLSEGRWIKDTKYLRGCIDFWLSGSGKGNSRSFTSWLVSGIYDYYGITGDKTVFALIDLMKEDYSEWEKSFLDTGRGLFVSNNGVDGMEYSAVAPAEWGVSGYRPTANSYRYGDSVAIAEFCRLMGDTEGEALYLKKAEKLKSEFEKALWDNQSGFYKWIRQGTDMKTVPLELIGYIPWMFGLATDDTEHAKAWDYLGESEYFASPHGMRTVEKKYASEVSTGDIGSGLCRWDGPVWPFATSQTLCALYRFIQKYESGADYADLYYGYLREYALSQYKDGYPWIAEDIDGETGKWIADCERSPLYNHSSFADLVVSGLFGIRGEEGRIVIEPLAPDGWDYFSITDVSVIGHSLSVVFDRDGSHFGGSKGLTVILDGKISTYGEISKIVIDPE